GDTAAAGAVHVGTPALQDTPRGRAPALSQAQPQAPQAEERGLMNRPGREASQRLALILSGGGSRAAYQVGVLAGLRQLTGADAPNPFPIITGTSAGAINALALATHSASLHTAVDSMLAVWAGFRSDHVMRTDWPGLLAQAWRWSRTNLLGTSGGNTTALLDNSPLRSLLARHMRFGCIEEGLQAGRLQAVSVCAFDYHASRSVYFYQSHHRITPWRRHLRVGVQTRLGPPLDRGADRVLVIGVTHRTGSGPASMPAAAADQTPPPPTLPQLGGHLLHSTFLDNLDPDLEQLERLNSLASHSALHGRDTGLRHVDVMVISPSEPLDVIAARHRR